MVIISFFFFFQAEDGIRDYKVTGVQTCALPICYAAASCRFVLCPVMLSEACGDLLHQFGPRSQIGSLVGGVRDGIPNTRVALGFAHILPPNSCPNRLFAISSSFFGVRCRTYTTSARLAK